VPLAPRFFTPRNVTLALKNTGQPGELVVPPLQVFDCTLGHLGGTDAPDPLSGSPAFAVRDAAASSCTFVRIGPNGPYLCCSKLKPSTYGPYGVSIGF
jgi:hypothetical protein